MDLSISDIAMNVSRQQRSLNPTREIGFPTRDGEAHALMDRSPASTVSRFNRRHDKLGFTLIELLIAIGLTFTMLSTAVFTIHLLLRAERTAGRTIEYTRSVSRLSRQFRSDVHAASRARFVPVGANEPNGVELVLPNRLVLYAVSDNGLERIETEDGQICRRDQFGLEPLSEIKFALIGKPVRVRLVVRIPPSTRHRKNDHSGINRNVVIEPTVGRDLRFEVSQ